MVRALAAARSAHAQPAPRDRASSALFCTLGGVCCCRLPHRGGATTVHSLIVRRHRAKITFFFIFPIPNRAWSWSAKQQLCRLELERGLRARICLFERFVLYGQLRRRTLIIPRRLHPTRRSSVHKQWGTDGRAAGGVRVYPSPQRPRAMIIYERGLSFFSRNSA